MFTGIVEATAKIVQKSKTGIIIERPKKFTDVKIGSSIAVSGACLSIVKLTKTNMSFDVIPETWKRTRFSNLKKGDRVNLERAMKMGDRFDGHMVQGHVEAVAAVVNVEKPYRASLQIDVPKNLARFITTKGSLTLDGVSLTIAAVKKNRVTVALIPHTLKTTTLGALKKGDSVNVETDIMMRGKRKLA
ncbi:riboflavin synthase [Candidatus Peregrinibacteria bacterium]|nr:riboflavin synthase [Candidatus Peregrinibacteria bacterium]